DVPDHIFSPIQSATLKGLFIHRPRPVHRVGRFSYHRPHSTLTEWRGEGALGQKSQRGNQNHYIAALPAFWHPSRVRMGTYALATGGIPPTLQTPGYQSAISPRSHPRPSAYRTHHSPLRLPQVWVVRQFEMQWSAEADRYITHN